MSFIGADIARSAGVLLNISSLSNRFAIGGLGKEAKEFAETITRGGFFWWQVLPVTAVGLGNSPYSGVSLFSGNELYIDPDRLVRDGFVGESDAIEAEVKDAEYAVNYEVARATKGKLIDKAFKNFIKNRDELMAFADNNRKWVYDYAIFLTIKSVDSRPWWKWDKALRHRDADALHKFAKEHDEIFVKEIFKQYLFERQWQEMRKEVNALGVGIIGDMPIYPARDSVDVWVNPEIFLLDDKLKPKKLAGVPPDYFSKDGQLWGNPVYDWKRLKSDKYSWWIRRMNRMAELYDCVRIDHFRGLDRFWTVSPNEKTAKKGVWKKAHGAKMLEAVRREVKGLRIIAEDLGVVDDGVRELLKTTELPSMRVMQFAFSDGDSTHLPHNYNVNTVAYTGTHDNDTLLGWYFAQPENIKNYVKRYIGIDDFDGHGGGDCELVRAMAATLIKSSAKLAILPYQDLCGYGSDCRMNTPGVANGNWGFRASRESINTIDFDYYANLNGLYGRARPTVDI